MVVGDVIREASGADYSLWRVEETFGPDSPYVSNHKFHRAGNEKRMARKEQYKVEPNPEGIAGALDAWIAEIRSAYHGAKK